MVMLVILSVLVSNTISAILSEAESYRGTYVSEAESYRGMYVCM